MSYGNLRSEFVNFKEATEAMYTVLHGRATEKNGAVTDSVYRTSRDATVVVMSLDVADHELNAESIDKVAFRSLRHDA